MSSEFPMGSPQKACIRFTHRTKQGDRQYEFHAFSFWGGIDLERPGQMQIYMSGVDDTIELSITDPAIVHRLTGLLLDNVQALKTKKEGNKRDNRLA